MAFKKDYYERKQIKKREKYGKLEKRSELLLRLKKNKENKKVVKDIKSVIENVTGKEYFFKYHSIKNVNGQLAKIEYDSKDELAKKLNFVNQEISRIEKKLLNFSASPQNKRFVFDDDGNKLEVKNEISNVLSDDLLEYKTYLKQLIETDRKSVV